MPLYIQSRSEVSSGVCGTPLSTTTPSTSSFSNRHALECGNRVLELIERHKLAIQARMANRESSFKSMLEEKASRRDRRHALKIRTLAGKRTKKDEFDSGSNSISPSATPSPNLSLSKQDFNPTEVRKTLVKSHVKDIVSSTNDDAEEIMRVSSQNSLYNSGSDQYFEPPPPPTMSQTVDHKPDESLRPRQSPNVRFKDDVKNEDPNPPDNRFNPNNAPSMRETPNPDLNHGNVDPEYENYKRIKLLLQNEERRSAEKAVNEITNPDSGQTKSSDEAALKSYKPSIIAHPEFQQLFNIPIMDKAQPEILEVPTPPISKKATLKASRRNHAPPKSNNTLTSDARAATSLQQVSNKIGEINERIFDPDEDPGEEDSTDDESFRANHANNNRVTFHSSPTSTPLNPPTSQQQLELLKNEIDSDSYSDSDFDSDGSGSESEPTNEPRDNVSRSKTNVTANPEPSLAFPASSTTATPSQDISQGGIIQRDLRTGERDALPQSSSSSSSSSSEGGDRRESAFSWIGTKLGEFVGTLKSLTWDEFCQEYLVSFCIILALLLILVGIFVMSTEDEKNPVAILNAEKKVEPKLFKYHGPVM